MSFEDRKRKLGDLVSAWIAGAFVRESHLKENLPRFAGWWGHNKSSRFKMGPDFDPIPTVEAWQLSNPPIFQLAALRASLDLFDQAGIQALRERGDRLTSALEEHLLSELGSDVEIVTPKGARGSMLCMRFKNNPKLWAHMLVERDVHVDFREPDIIRATPAPIYNSYADIHCFVSTLKEVIHESR
jgi:kynureninase